MMDRRAFIATAAAFFAAPLLADAQPAGRVSRIGFLSPSITPTPAAPLRALDAFRQRLGELGYAEGQNLVIELRFAEGKLERLSVLAAELVQLNPDVIVTQGSLAS